MWTTLNDSDTAARLALRKRILDLIDQRRESERDAGIGGSIERRIIAEELALIEQHTRSYEEVESSLAELHPECIQENDAGCELVGVTVKKTAKRPNRTVPAWATMSHGGQPEPV